MTAAGLNRIDSKGLWLNIGALVALVLVGNALIFGLGADGGSLPPAQARWVPPGPLVGAIWVVQFALMGAARWFYLCDTRDHGWRSWLPVVLAAMCLAFPVYTGGLGSPAAGAIGTLVTLVATLAVMLTLGRRSSTAAWALVPLAIWGSYVACVYYLA
jgi:tryptophan-rich sensory protein